MKKTIMFIIMLAVCFLVMPVALADTKYPTVTDITNPDTLMSGNVSLSDIKDDTLTVTVENAKFKLLDKDTTGANRPLDNGAWIGLHFAFPEETKEWKIGEETSYPDNEFDEYFGFDLERLKTAAQNKEDYTATFTMTWKETTEGEAEHSLNIKIVVKPESVVLVDKTEDKENWNETEYLKESVQVKFTTIVEYNGATAEESAYVDKGSAMVSEAEVRKGLEELLGKDIVVVGFYSDAAMTKKFDFSQKLDENTILYVKLADAKKETNPATGDNLLTYVSLSVVALTGALGTGLYLRKVNE